MNTEKLLYSMSNINEEYIYDASKKASKRPQIIRKVAVIAAVLLTVLFFHTEIGVKAVEYIKNITTEFFESIFSDKDIPVFVEGVSEYVSHSAMGEISVEETNSSGFSMYYDTERYESLNENGIYYIRPKRITVSREEIIKYNSAILEGFGEIEKESEIQRLIDEQEDFYNSLPVCEIEIVRIKNTPPEESAEEHKTSLKNKSRIITETEKCDNHDGVHFFVSQGDNWNSEEEHIYFIDDEKGGVFRVTARYFGEAAEGHGNRFRQMIDTFEVVQ